jgi:hypothetical protein
MGILLDILLDILLLTGVIDHATRPLLAGPAANPPALLL